MSDTPTETKSKFGCGCIVAIGACLSIILVIIFVFVFYLRLHAPVLVEETFEGGDTGWIVVGDAQGDSDKPTYMKEGGNPGAHMSAVDDAVGGVWFWSAPDTFLSQLRKSWKESGSMRAVLTFDLKQSDLSDPFEDKDLVLGAGDLELHFRHESPPGLDWTSFRVPLNPADWINPSTEKAATEEEMTQVFSELDRLWIRGEFRTGDDVGGIDNIRIR